VQRHTHTLAAPQKYKKYAASVAVSTQQHHIKIPRFMSRRNFETVAV
jgi:hypothetical protein